MGWFVLGGCYLDSANIPIKERLEYGLAILI